MSYLQTRIQKLDVRGYDYRFLPVFCCKLHILQFLIIVTNYIAVILQYIILPQNVFKYLCILLNNRCKRNHINNPL